MLHGWGFSPAFDNIFTTNTYIGNVGEEEGVYFPSVGAPLPNDPVSLYRYANLPKTDELIIMIEHLKMMQMPFWASAS